MIDVVKELKEFGCHVDITDCWASSDQAREEYGVTLTQDPQQGIYDAVLLPVTSAPACAGPFKVNNEFTSEEL